MKRVGGVPIVVLGLLAAIIAWGGSVPGHAQTGDSNGLGASVPGPVPVTVDARTTALLLLDFVPATCNTDACLDTVPAAVRLLQKANAAGSLVVFSTIPVPPPASTPFPQLRTLAPNAPIVAGFPDKFNFPTGTLTPLLGILTGHNPPIQTVVITGTCACGAVLYTTFEANNAGFTTVVAEDTVSADNPFEDRYIKFQLLNVPVFGNPTNIPLLPDATTLSRGDLITFR